MKFDSRKGDEGYVYDADGNLCIGPNGAGSVYGDTETGLCGFHKVWPPPSNVENEFVEIQFKPPLRVEPIPYTIAWLRHEISYKTASK